MQNTAPTFSAELMRLDACKITSLAGSVAAESVALVSANRLYGEDAVIAYLEGHITALCDFVNLRGTMIPDQARLTAELAISEFPHLTLSDIALIFRRAKLGQYGEFYGRIDGQMILSWFGKYFEERCVFCAEKSILEAHTLSSNSPVTSDRSQEFIHQLINRRK